MRLTGLTALALSLSLSLLPDAIADDATRAKFAKLAQAGSGVIKLDAKLHDELVAADRDWSAVVQYTALGKEFNCAPCHLFKDSFRAVAKSWSKVAKSNRDTNFFASIDFADGQSVFRKMGYTTAPVVVYHPAESGPHKPANPQNAGWQYDFGGNSFDPEPLAEQLSNSLPVKVPYSKPPNYALIVGTAGTLLISAVAAKFAWTYFSGFILSRWTWAFFVIVASTIFNSGYMFTRIRSSPFGQNTREGVQWIAGGYSNQFGAETWIISTLYGGLALSQIALIILVPRTLKPAQQRIAIYIWSVVTLLLYSVLMSIFKIKNGSYPFRLLF